MEKFFAVNVKQYAEGRCFEVYRPASLADPKDHAVMFIMKKYLSKADALMQCENCLVFWPLDEEVPEELAARHAVVPCQKPHREFARFFRDNHIANYPAPESGQVKNGAFIADTAVIGEGCVIMPGAYIGGQAVLGRDCYIGSGVKLVGRVHLGDRVVIRENSVLGADGLTTDRDEQGQALTIPQFGGIRIEDDVQIGALTVIARGAIDDTVIRRGAKIDNSSFISHNVCIGEDTFVVGETIMFGSSSAGTGSLISGNAAVRNGVHIGDHVTVGMGSVVLKDIDAGSTVAGNPAGYIK